MKFSVGILALASLVSAAQKILLTNDDGWAVAQIRDEYNQLKAAGYEVILSAPAVNKSGTGSSTATPTTLTTACEFNTCAAGSAATGTDASDSNIHYVNAFPVDATRFGIQNFSQALWGSAPDFTVAGTNVGNNLGSVVKISGTVGAACESAKEGVPSFAFSGSSGSQVSYTTLSDTSASSTITAHVHTSLILQFLTTYLAASGDSTEPLVPSGYSVNINFSSTSTCSNKAANYAWVATRVLTSTAGVDTPLCGSSNLPDETTVNGAGCFATVSVIDANTKDDAPAAAQKAVFDRLASILTCTN
ncbi:survival protein sure-like phosphatase/nucleotidase [Macrolepiota fuliginosa MF-IS2]|uniref:Survival protein sure-like phosphatase/nucleotidase n=1 Tax=Macrolepiota fuliginosa MF-IS2 TaxID=1400762 RepID=A0A9P5XCT5_9AGAR|nr:survival protein sure-like phosphatase/nucleotidase [Macrolepiota fuliginosa MF-IS2]